MILFFKRVCWLRWSGRQPLDVRHTRTGWEYFPSADAGYNMYVTELIKFQKDYPLRYRLLRRLKLL